jgi:hypothetical protein
MPFWRSREPLARVADPGDLRRVTTLGVRRAIHAGGDPPRSEQLSNRSSRRRRRPTGRPPAWDPDPHPRQARRPGTWASTDPHSTGVAPNGRYGTVQAVASPIRVIRAIARASSGLEVTHVGDDEPTGIHDAGRAMLVDASTRRGPSARCRVTGSRSLANVSRRRSPCMHPLHTTTEGTRAPCR